MDYGTRLANSLYHDVIELMIAELITDQFGTNFETFSKLLKTYLETPESKASVELTRRKDDRIPAEFLTKKNFTSMYVGGTVLATCPMLYAMVGAPLMSSRVPGALATREHYDDHLSVAVKHYKSLTGATDLMDDEQCSVTTVPTSSPPATKA